MKKEMRNPHPSELLVSEYFNHSTMDSKLSLLTGYVSDWNLSNQMGREKTLLLTLHLLKIKDSFSMFKVRFQYSLRE